MKRAKLLHLSLLLMVIGGCLTWLTSVRGTIHLRPGIEVCDFVDSGGEVRKLPFSLTLKEFQTDYYPGMSFPQDFRSILTIDGTEMAISMNRIGRVGAWRIYQQSFDGQGGSIVEMVRDPWGILAVYLGFILFAVAGFPMLFGRKALSLGLLCVSLGAMASPVNESQQVIFNGRVVPYATVASELTFKLTGAQKVGGMNSSDFVYSLMEYPRLWAEKPFLKTKAGFISPASLYDAQGQYIPQLKYQGGEGKEDAELLRIDEKIALLSQLWQGELFIPAPEESRRPEAEVRAEVLYVKIQPVKWFFMFALMFGIIGVIPRIGAIGRIGSMVAFGLSLLIFSWRWWILGHCPVVGTGEVMFFASLCLCGCSVWLWRKYAFAGALSLIMAGFAALISWLNVKNPSMTPLMPVLNSPWLSIHVSMVMISYALLGMVSILALGSLIRRRFMVVVQKLLPVGVYFLGLGIIVGSMWANVSWGRYWGWDPKETAALITFLVYSVALHPWFKRRLTARGQAIFLTAAFLTILMTYVGVNYLPSLHSYQ
ncbi:MAG: cytochrome c biogenesis protein CcsA [Bacteroidales bacterium]|nr:cytochrome c biogenesis protein CcsA [Bacteroidales bacterium]